MSFVQPANYYSGLHQEFRQDLSGVGYSGALAVQDTDTLARLIDAIGSGQGYMIWRNDIAPREVVNIVQPADFTALTQIQLSKIQLLFQGAPIDATLSGLRQNFQNIFSGTATLLSGFLSGMASRLGSRAEVLFGTGASVTSQDVALALKTSG